MVSVQISCVIFLMFQVPTRGCQALAVVWRHFWQKHVEQCRRWYFLLAPHKVKHLNFHCLTLFNISSTRCCNEVSLKRLSIQLHRVFYRAPARTIVITIVSHRYIWNLFNATSPFYLAGFLAADVTWLHFQVIAKNTAHWKTRSISREALCPVA